MAELALAEFRVKYPKHQVVAEVWSRNWQHVIPFFGFPEEIRKIIYTTNAVESLHMTLRKVTKNRGSFRLRNLLSSCFTWRCKNVSKKWSTVQGWREALRQFAIRWPDHFDPARAAARKKSNLSNNMGIAFTQSPSHPQAGHESDVLSPPHALMHADSENCHSIRCGHTPHTGGDETTSHSETPGIPHIPRRLVWKPD